MDLGIKNRVALVAASSRGLGKAVAWELAREGVKLVICARNKEILEQTADEILLDTGVTVFPLAVDLSNPNQIDWMINETLDLFGKVDILVTNAGGPPAGNFSDLTDKEWMEAAQLTLMSAVRLVRKVLPSMQKQKWGRIIHMTSVSLKQPIDRLFLSNVFRPGVAGMAKSLSNELAKENILVNTVCPGYFMTERVKELISAQAEKTGRPEKEIEKEITGKIPLGRMGNPEELASLIAFLASEKASYITGATVQVDGGYIQGLL